MNNAQFETPKSSTYSEADIAEFNRRHDQKYGWKQGAVAYEKSNPIHRLFGPPKIDKNLSERELNQLVWEAHNKKTSSP